MNFVQNGTAMELYTARHTVIRKPTVSLERFASPSQVEEMFATAPLQDPMHLSTERHVLHHKIVRLENA